MDTFAKLFHSERTGQVLVMLDSGDEGPEVQFHFKPIGLGVYKVKLGFPDTDAGQAAAEGAFAKVDEAMAIKIVQEALDGPVGCFTHG